MTRHRAIGALVAAMAARFVGTEPEPCRLIEVTHVSFRADRTYYSDTRVVCHDEYNNPYTGRFEARSWVVDETTSVTVGEDTCEQCSGRYGEKVWVGAVGGTTTPEHCYQAYVSASSAWCSPEEGSGQQCAPAICTDSNANGICDNQEPNGPDPNEDSCPGGPPCTSPIVIDYSGGAYKLAGPADAVEFDMDADGTKERITWTLRESPVAFLAFDRNGDQQISDGRELFGNWTLLRSGERASNGFEALKEFDINQDGVVSAGDLEWASLLTWIDANHDGMSQPDEIRALSQTGVRSIETAYRWTGRRDAFGNLLAYKATATFDRGAWPVYDVFFRTVP